jgi:hypothetical protein
VLLASGLFLPLLLQGVPAAAKLDEPRLIILPDPVVVGEEVTVRGIDFCGRPGCSAVTIRLSDAVVAGETLVRSDGEFEVSFNALVDLGDHVVAATQVVDGQSVTAEAQLTVIPAGDFPTPTVAAPTATPPLNTPTQRPTSISTPTSPPTPPRASATEAFDSGTIAPSDSEPPTGDLEASGGPRWYVWLLTALAIIAAFLSAATFVLRRGRRT